MMLTQKIKIICVLILGLGLAAIYIAPLSIHSKVRAASGPLQLALDPFATGLDDPVGLTNAGDNRLFVIEREGRIKIIQPTGVVSATPFLDITARVDSSDGEEGLLGLAFHPDYAGNGFFYVNYTNTTGGISRTRISRFSVTADPDLADPDSEEILLTIDDPAPNHNAGAIHFSPTDFYLYIPMGDGGGSGDSGNNAQALDRLLGKIIRIDVDVPGGIIPDSDCKGVGSGNYLIPPTNPLRDGPGNTCDEIWAIGLRNPFQSSFDRSTGDLYIGDVGQGDWEEIDFQLATSSGGENYGWNCYEGNQAFPTSWPCAPPLSYTFPIFVYPRDDSFCSAVIGGYVYRGSAYPAMVGHYLLADYCSGEFWDLEFQGGVWQVTHHTNLANFFSYSAFGEDAAGELYVADRGDGIVYRLTETTQFLKTFLPMVLKRSKK